MLASFVVLALVSEALAYQVVDIATSQAASDHTRKFEAQACGEIGQLPCGGAFPSSYMPDASSCTPQCTWQCDEPRCDEVCEPVCAPPRCETRCNTPDLSGCSMDCSEPDCAVVCPNTNCPARTCAECSTTCSEPMCRLDCPQSQPCHNVCEQPSCEWSCSAPEECPAPQCHMVCESPRNCMGATYQAMPPLSAGETSVRSFIAPSDGSSAADRDGPGVAARVVARAASAIAGAIDGSSLLQVSSESNDVSETELVAPSNDQVSVTALYRSHEQELREYQIKLPMAQQ